MFPRAPLAASLVVSILLYGVTATGCAQRGDRCLESIPISLHEMIKHNYPDWGIVTLDILEASDRKLFLEDTKGQCPGITKVDFYGDGTKVFAIVLTKGKGFDRRSRLILGQQIGDKQWKLTTLEDDVTGKPPVVLTEPPGEYKGVYKQERRTLRSKHEAILFVGYESWAIVYAWTGRDIDKVWVSD